MIDIQHYDQTDTFLKVLYVDGDYNIIKKVVIPNSYIEDWRERMNEYSAIDQSMVVDIIEAYRWDLKKNMKYLLEKSIINEKA